MLIEIPAPDFMISLCPQHMTTQSKNDEVRWDEEPLKGAAIELDHFKLLPSLQDGSLAIITHQLLVIEAALPDHLLPGVEGQKQTTVYLPGLRLVAIRRAFQCGEGAK